MAKKAAPKKKAAKKSTKKPAKKSQPKVEHVEIELTAAEESALKLAETSDEVCRDLEESVTQAICASVRKVFKARKVTLSSEEAEKVALVLFGD